MKTKNLLVVLLDCCRYDAFENANAPNFKSLGVLYKCYSPSHWTTPSIVSYILGEVPLGCPREYRNDLYGFRWDGKGDRCIKTSDVFCGYYSANVGFYSYIDMRDLLPNYFKVDKVYGSDIISTDTTKRTKAREIFKEIIHDIKHRDTKYFRIFAHLEETAYPWEYERDEIETSKRNFKFCLDAMSRAIDIIDEEFKYVLDNLTEPVRIIIMADHAELINDAYYDGRRLAGHGAAVGRVEFHPKLFEIPLIVCDRE